MEALIWRRPKPPKPYRETDPFDTIVLARGERDAMLARWAIADKRLHAYGLEGHLEVRDESDPKVPPAKVGWWSEPIAPEAWLAVLAGDRVVVHIYGNTYGATITKSNPKSIEARFSARTRKGGWGGETPLRVRSFPLGGSTYNRGVERVIELVPQP